MGRAQAFHCIKFATPLATTADNGNTRYKADVEACLEGGQGGKDAPKGGDGQHEEILAVTASLKMVHFARVPLAAIEVGVPDQ